MPRQRTKGDRIQVQLPLDVDAAVRARAAKTERTPAAVVENVVTDAYRKAGRIDHADPRGVRPTAQITPTAARIEPTETVKLPPLERPTMEIIESPPLVVGAPFICEHPESQHAPVGSTGLKRCKSCGKTRGVDGTWR